MKFIVRSGPNSMTIVSVIATFLFLFTNATLLQAMGTRRRSIKDIFSLCDSKMMRRQINIEIDFR